MRIASIVAVLLMFASCVAAQNYPTAGAPSAPAPSASTSSNWPTAQFAATAAKDPGVQKAKQILDDMIRALGGEAYLTLREMSIEGRSYAFYHGKPSGLGIVYWRFWQWPDKDRYEITKQRDIIDFYVGDKGYETTYKGTTALDPKQLSDYLRRREHSLEWVIRNWLPAPGSMILYEGTAIVEQNLADKVTILTASNDSVTIAVDPRTSSSGAKDLLPIVIPSTGNSTKRRRSSATTKRCRGLHTPYSTVRMDNGEMSNQRFVNSVSYNNGLDASLFEPKGLLYNQPKTSANQAPVSRQADASHRDCRGNVLVKLDKSAACNRRNFCRVTEVGAHFATDCCRNTTLGDRL